MLFESIANSQWFVNTSIILFLNKIDLFKEKLQHTPVKKYFPDYNGPAQSYDHAYQYFRDCFMRLNRNSKKVGILPRLPLRAHAPMLISNAGGLRASDECNRHQSPQDHHGQRTRHCTAEEFGDSCALIFPLLLVCDYDTCCRYPSPSHVEIFCHKTPRFPCTKISSTTCSGWQ